MKKVILFLWFGDERPKYVNWTLDNFRKMNPGWEVRFIEYSTSQILNYREQNDPILNKVMSSRNKFGYIGNVTNEYRKEYLNAHLDEIVVYCDLDCFPIAPLDNFIVTPDKKFADWVLKNIAMGRDAAKNLGYWIADRKDMFVQRSDSWCMCNSKLISTGTFLMIHKEFCASDDIVFEESIIMNKQYIQSYKQRSKKFHEMKLNLGDNFCISKLSPIEHYYSRERDILNTELRGNI